MDITIYIISPLFEASTMECARFQPHFSGIISGQYIWNIETRSANCTKPIQYEIYSSKLRLKIEGIIHTIPITQESNPIN